MKDVLLWTGAGQIGMAIARRVGFNQKIIVGDKNIENAKTIAKIMRGSGFDIEPGLHRSCQNSPQNRWLHIGNQRHLWHGCRKTSRVAIG